MSELCASKIDSEYISRTQCDLQHFMKQTYSFKDRREDGYDVELFLTWTSKFCAALLALGSMVDDYSVLDDSYDALAGDPQY